MHLLKHGLLLGELLGFQLLLQGDPFLFSFALALLLLNPLLEFLLFSGFVLFFDLFDNLFNHLLLSLELLLVDLLLLGGGLLLLDEALFLLL